MKTSTNIGRISLTAAERQVICYGLLLETVHDLLRRFPGPDFVTQHLRFVQGNKTCNSTTVYKIAHLRYMIGDVLLCITAPVANYKHTHVLVHQSPQKFFAHSYNAQFMEII